MNYCSDLWEKHHLILPCPGWMTIKVNSNLNILSFWPLYFHYSLSLFSFKEPSTVIPKLDNQRSNHSLLVKWVHPVGGLDMYILNISSEGWSSSKVLNSTECNHTFSQLKAATIFTVTLTTVKAAFRETSHSVNMATCEYPTPNYS